LEWGKAGMPERDEMGGIFETTDFASSFLGSEECGEDSRAGAGVEIWRRD
jgi:hypothetical protein